MRPASVASRANRNTDPRSLILKLFGYAAKTIAVQPIAAPGFMESSC
jgi:hypothetical protein